MSKKGDGKSKSNGKKGSYNVQVAGEQTPLLPGQVPASQEESSCPSFKSILNTVIGVGMPAALAYTLYEFFVALDPEKIELMTKILDGAEGGLFLKSIYDYFSAPSSTASKVAAILSNIKCLTAMIALSYNLYDGKNEHHNENLAPQMFLGVFGLSTLVNLITACAKGVSATDRAAQLFGAGANVTTGLGVYMGLLLKSHTKTWGYAVTAAQGMTSIVNGVAAFFRPSPASESVAADAESGLFFSSSQ